MGRRFLLARSAEHLTWTDDYWRVNRSQVRTAMTETKAMNIETEIRELDRRRNDGIDVTMFWNSRTNTVVIAVEDEREGESFELEVQAADALQAFHHPYAFASASLN